MTVAEILQRARSERSEWSEEVAGEGGADGAGEISLSIEVLLAFVLGKDRAWLMAHSEAPVSQEQERQFGEFFLRFRAGEPVAYLTGKKEFYGLEFLVNKSVLIPRPETEMLVERVLEFARRPQAGARKGGRGSGLKVLDIGTGSGCIAVSLAKHLPDAQITAVDISTEALETAKKNAQLHEVVPRVKFLESDLLANVEGEFDIVVTNLPYIGTERHAILSREVREYEPHTALFGGADGLRLYERLFEQMAVLAWKPRLFFGEFGFSQGFEMRQLLNKFFIHADVLVEKDLASIERIFVVRFGGNF